ncbi:ThiF family adenylyltransferase [Sphingobium yanoikuyae]|uniref:ThiF family adenylyltransferase n=1 Tax=Sphingobium yanoikuyae TaxID=13690 RepID=UPI000262B5A7|nr:ThiF family adenylyltransferase [Sphingobium yanoikuyae]
MTLTRELALAKTQIEEIVAFSHGALELLDEPALIKDGRLKVSLSIATRGYRREGGLPFRDRERVNIYVSASFPLKPPIIHFAHKRFAGTAHVQWGTYICLYQSSETEWIPADGMFGFVDRIDAWLAAAGAGELDPVDGPLHPPVAYVSTETSVVVRADAPEVDGLWIGFADTKSVSEYRRDLVGWSSLDDWGEGNFAGNPSLAILLPEPMPFEYPAKVNDLVDSLKGSGVEFGTLWRALRVTAVFTPADQPGYMVIGAPMRRRAAGEPLRPHLAIWEIAAEDLQNLRDYIAGGGDDAEKLNLVVNWMVTAKVGWCSVDENRPEVTNRRDLGTTAAGVAGKKVALLGCGALGSAVAEMLVRAGVMHLRLIDYKRVSPGLLVRQRFTDADIGRLKAYVLKERLDALGQGCEIEAECRNLENDVLAALEGQQFDVVIDATASRTVAHRLELDLAQAPLHCPLVTMALSAGAQHGSVAVRMPGHLGGPVAIERAVKLEAFQRDRRHPLVEAFWPDKPPAMVLPEPGCSSPTFIGSAADVDHHAAGLLNVGLIRVATLRNICASMDLCASIWAPLHGSADRRLSYELNSPSELSERRHGYQALVSIAAERGITTELRRNARLRSSKVETGGLIFGEIDESSRRIWIDSVSGPPADSEMSEDSFLCGTAGTVALAGRRCEASGGSSRFVGIWHTHPVSAGRPSDEDMRAMVQLLLLQPNPPRHVIMLIVGFAETRPDPNLYLYHRNDFQILAGQPAGLGGGVG